MQYTEHKAPIKTKELINSNDSADKITVGLKNCFNGVAAVEVDWGSALPQRRPLGHGKALWTGIRILKRVEETLLKRSKPDTGP